LFDFSASRFITGSRRANISDVNVQSANVQSASIHDTSQFFSFSAWKSAFYGVGNFLPTADVLPTGAAVLRVTSSASGRAAAISLLVFSLPLFSLAAFTPLVFTLSILPISRLSLAWQLCRIISVINDDDLVRQLRLRSCFGFKFKLAIFIFFCLFALANSVR
jgi:hypothetical protein